MYFLAFTCLILIVVGPSPPTLEFTLVAAFIGVVLEFVFNKLS